MKTLLLIGIAALFLATGAAHAGQYDPVVMPNALHGEWCFESGDKPGDQQIFVRITPDKECHGGDNGITVDTNGWGGEGSCSPNKVEQITPNAWQIKAS